jgi:hypothetical protein
MKMGTILDEHGNIVLALSLEPITTKEGDKVQPFLKPSKVGHTAYEFDAPNSVIKDNRIVVGEIKKVIDKRTVELRRVH